MIGYTDRSRPETLTALKWNNERERIGLACELFASFAVGESVVLWSQVPGSGKHAVASVFREALRSLIEFVDVHEAGDVRQDSFATEDVTAWLRVGGKAVERASRARARWYAVDESVLAENGAALKNVLRCSLPCLFFATGATPFNGCVRTKGARVVRLPVLCGARIAEHVSDLLSSMGARHSHRACLRVAKLCDGNVRLAEAIASAAAKALTAPRAMRDRRDLALTSDHVDLTYSRTFPDSFRHVREAYARFSKGLPHSTLFAEDHPVTVESGCWRDPTYGSLCGAMPHAGGRSTRESNVAATLEAMASRAETFSSVDATRVRDGPHYFPSTYSCWTRSFVRTGHRETPRTRSSK